MSLLWSKFTIVPGNDGLKAFHEMIEVRKARGTTPQNSAHPMNLDSVVRTDNFTLRIA
jgi:hypothetical protein